MFRRFISRLIRKRESPPQRDPFIVGTRVPYGNKESPVKVKWPNEKKQ